MAQVIINGFKLNAYITCGAKQVFGKNDKIKLVNLVYFNCTMEAQRDEELFVESFNKLLFFKVNVSRFVLFIKLTVTCLIKFAHASEDIYANLFIGM